MYSESMLLQPELLIGTWFKALLLWCLIRISSTSGCCEYGNTVYANFEDIVRATRPFLLGYCPCWLDQVYVPRVA